MSEAWIALVGTVFGGAGLKITEQFLGRNKVRDDTATALRDELRKELSEAREEADQLREEADKWRQRYYSMVSSITTGDVTGALRKIENFRE